MALAGCDVFAQLLGRFIQLDVLKQLLEGLSADPDNGLVFDLRIFGIDLIFNLQPLVFGEQLLVGEIFVIARIEHHIAVEVDNLLHIPQGHIEQDRHIAGNPLQIPNVGHRGRQLDEAHPVTTHPTFGDLHSAAFANDAAVPHPFVLTAMAFPILGRTKDFFAKQPIHFWFERAVVDGFRLGNLTHHLAIGQGALPPLHDPLGGSERDLDVIEVVFGAEVAVRHRGWGARRSRERGYSAISRRRSPRRRGIHRWACWGCCGGD